MAAAAPVLMGFPAPPSAMTDDSAAKKKGKAAAQERRRYIAFLDKRVAALHREGVLGRLARDQADREWVEERKKRDG